MVERGALPVLPQVGGNLLAAGAVADVDNAGALHSPAHGEELPGLVFRLPDYVAEVLALEAGLQEVGLAEAELVHYVRRHLRRCRGGEGYHRSVHDATQRPYLKIVRAEVVAPLGYAVGFVHNYEVYGEEVAVTLEQVCIESLRGYVQEFTLRVIGGVVQGQVNIVALHSRVDGQGLDPPLLQVLHLVLHQRHQRGDHQGQAVTHQRRHLEAHALAPSRGEQGKGVAAFQCGGYNLLLHRPEGIIPPIFLKYL